MTEIRDRVVDRARGMRDLVLSDGCRSRALAHAQLAGRRPVVGQWLDVCVNPAAAGGVEPSFAEMIETWIEMAWQDGLFGWIQRGVHQKRQPRRWTTARLARCVVEQGWSLRRAAERFQVSVNTATRWAADIASRAQLAWPIAHRVRTAVPGVRRCVPSGASSTCVSLRRPVSDNGALQGAVPSGLIWRQAPPRFARTVDWSARSAKCTPAPTTLSSARRWRSTRHRFGSASPTTSTGFDGHRSLHVRSREAPQAPVVKVDDNRRGVEQRRADPVGAGPLCQLGEDGDFDRATCDQVAEHRGPEIR